MPIYNVNCPGCGDTPSTSDYVVADSEAHSLEVHSNKKKHKEFEGRVQAFEHGKSNK